MTKESNIAFNKPFLTGNESSFMAEVVRLGKLSGNGDFTKKCHQFFADTFGFKRSFLTSSGTDALEMMALLINVGPGDEVILPSYTFVSSANPFVMRGAKVVFADSSPDSPSIDIGQIEPLITEKTKAIMVVHYAGIAIDMDAVRDIANRHNLFVLEDAALCIDSYYKGKPLGGIGDLGAYSFHETKNIISGEGGMLMVNNPDLIKRAEIIWEKGTNRAAFFRGEIDKYSWVDVGSSFLPNEMTAAFLWAQLSEMETIQNMRLKIWNRYESELGETLQKNGCQTPSIPDYATNNAHCYYLVTPDHETRNNLQDHLRSKGIQTAFHYLSLHKSPFFKSQHDGRELPESDRYSECLLRLPLYAGLLDEEVDRVIDGVLGFLKRG